MNRTSTDHLSNDAVLHVANSPDDVARATAAAAALTNADPQLRVRVIVNGAALSGLTDAAAPIAAGDGVTVEACQVGLRRRRIPEGELQSGIGTVASAIVAIVSAQRSGASYVRL